MSFILCSFWLSLEQRLPGNSALEVLAFPSHTKSSPGPCQECNPSTSSECGWLLKAGSLIRAVTRLGRSIHASPPFSWSCFLLSSHPRPPPKICHSCSAIITVCLPRKSITQDSWISRMGRGERRVSGQCYSSEHQLSYPWSHLPFHSMLQTSQKKQKLKLKSENLNPVVAQNPQIPLMGNITVPLLKFEPAKKSGQIFTGTITFRRWSYKQNHACRYPPAKVSYAMVNFNRVFSSKEIQVENPTLCTPDKNKTTARGCIYERLLIVIIFL